MNTPRAEPFKLYTSRQVWIADLVSLSPLGGAILMAVNCVRLGNRAGARVALSRGVAGTAALLAFVKLLSAPSPFATFSWLALLVVSVALERLISLEQQSAAARRVAEAAGTPSSWVAAGIGLACSVVLFAVIAVVELDGRLSTFVEHLFESRLTAEQRLDRLADLNVDTRLNISGSIAWMRQCKETTPADTVPYDHMCVANDSNLVMLVGTLRGLLHTVYAAQVGTERVDLAGGRGGASVCHRAPVSATPAA